MVYLISLMITFFIIKKSEADNDSSDDTNIEAISDLYTDIVSTYMSTAESITLGPDDDQSSSKPPNEKRDYIITDKIPDNQNADDNSNDSPDDKNVAEDIEEMSDDLYTEIVTMYMSTAEAESITDEPNDDQSSSKTFNENRHYIITDKTGKKIKITFPKIRTTFVDNHDGSVKVYLDRIEEFNGIECFQLILQHFTELKELDNQLGEDGGILTAKDTLYDYEDAFKAYRNKKVSLPYITAEVLELKNEFLLGDKMTYGGYYNGPVDNSRKYSLRVRGIIKEPDGEKIVIDTDVVGVFKSTWVTFLSMGGASIFFIVIIGFIISHFIRKKREKARIKDAIAKFNALLGDPDEVTHGPDPSGANHVTGANHVISPPLHGVSSSNTEWWDVSESETGDWNHNQDHGGEWDNSDQFPTAEAASGLLNDTEKHVVRRKSSKYPEQEIIISNTEVDLPYDNVREDEIYHF